MRTIVISHCALALAAGPALAQTGIPPGGVSVETDGARRVYYNNLSEARADCSRARGTWSTRSGTARCVNPGTQLNGGVPRVDVLTGGASSIVARPAEDPAQSIVVNHDYGYDEALINPGEARRTCVEAGGTFSNRAGRVRCTSARRAPSGGVWRPVPGAEQEQPGIFRDTNNLDAAADLDVLRLQGPPSQHVELTATLKSSTGDIVVTGTLLARVNPAVGQICWELNGRGIAQASAAHIHRGAAGRVGPPVVRLTTSGGSQRYQGCTNVSNGLARELAAGPDGFYVDVQSAAFRGGAIRGQLRGQTQPRPSGR